MDILDGPLSAYARAVRCPVPTCRMVTPTWRMAYGSTGIPYANTDPASVGTATPYLSLPHTRCEALTYQHTRLRGADVARPLPVYAFAITAYEIFHPLNLNIYPPSLPPPAIIQQVRAGRLRPCKTLPGSRYALLYAATLTYRMLGHCPTPLSTLGPDTALLYLATLTSRILLPPEGDRSASGYETAVVTKLLLCTCPGSDR
eukprot:50846-Rhodomonas_salina.3